MAKWMQLAQGKKLLWKTQFDVQLHACRKREKLQVSHPNLPLLWHTPTVPGGSCSEWHKCRSLWFVSPSANYFWRGETEHDTRLSHSTPSPRTQVSQRDGAALKRCQQHQEGKQCRLRLSASEYRQGRGSSWRLMQLNALPVSKAEMGTEQWDVFVMTESFLSVIWGSRALWSVIQCSLSDWNVFRLPVKVILAWQRWCYSKIHVQWAILAVRTLVRCLKGHCYSNDVVKVEVK